jgi:hypothetical protein
MHESSPLQKVFKKAAGILEIPCAILGELVGGNPLQPAWAGLPLLPPCVNPATNEEIAIRRSFFHLLPKLQDVIRLTVPLLCLLGGQNSTLFDEEPLNMAFNNGSSTSHQITALKDEGGTINTDPEKVKELAHTFFQRQANPVNGKYLQTMWQYNTHGTPTIWTSSSWKARPRTPDIRLSPSWTS